MNNPNSRILYKIEHVIFHRELFMVSN